jgi:hypothetical protein
MTMTIAENNTRLLKVLLDDWGRTSRLNWKADSDDRAALIRRAAAYLEKEPPAVSGQHGHDRCFHVACVLVCRFGLAEGEAFQAIAAWNARCEPPWSEKELRHKLAEAAKQPRPLDLAQPGTNGHTVNGAPVRPPAQAKGPEPWEPPIPLSELPAAEPFPVDVLPPDLLRLCEQIGWAVHCPVDYVAVPMLALAGGAAGNSRRLRVKAEFLLSTQLWVGVVGRKSTGKSSPLMLLARPILDRDIAAQEEYTKELKRRQEAPAENLPEPVLRQFYIDDTTTEGLRPVLQQNPRGVTVVVDELSAIADRLNQYRDAGKGSDRQFFLSLANHAPIKTTRKKDSDSRVLPPIVPCPFAAVAGTIQPSRLSALQGDPLAGGAEDGFFERFLLSYPDELPAFGEDWREPNPASLDAWTDALDRLFSLDMTPGPRPRPKQLGLTGCGRSAWAGWTAQNAAEMNHPDFPDCLRGVWGKAVMACGRLALTVHLLWWAAGGALEDADPLDGEAVVRGGRLADYFKAHARRIAHVGELDSRAQSAARVLTWLADQGATCTRRDLYRGVRSQAMFPRPESLNAPLRLLEQLHFVRPAGAEPKATGRPSLVLEINPLWDRSTPLDSGQNGQKRQN